METYILEALEETMFGLNTSDNEIDEILDYAKNTDFDAKYMPKSKEDFLRELRMMEKLQMIIDISLQEQKKCLKKVQKRMKELVISSHKR